MNEDERLIVNELIQISESGENANGITFKKVDYKKINNEVRKLNNALKFIDTDNITETNNLIVASIFFFTMFLFIPRQFIR